jgi:hypothetical protein
VLANLHAAGGYMLGGSPTENLGIIADVVTQAELSPEVRKQALDVARVEAVESARAAAEVLAKVCLACPHAVESAMVIWFPATVLLLLCQLQCSTELVQPCRIAVCTHYAGIRHKAGSGQVMHRRIHIQPRHARALR